MNPCMGWVLAVQGWGKGVEMKEDTIAEHLFWRNGCFPLWLSLMDIKDYSNFALADVWKFSSVSGTMVNKETCANTHMYAQTWRAQSLSLGSIGVPEETTCWLCLPNSTTGSHKELESVSCWIGHCEANLRPKWASHLLHLPLKPQRRSRKTLSHWLATWRRGAGIQLMCKQAREWEWWWEMGRDLASGPQCSIPTSPSR